MLFAILMATLAWAAGPEGLTLDRALSLAEQYNPQLRVAAAQIEGARAGILTARAYPNPEFNFLSGPQLSRWNNGLPGPPGLLQHYSVGQSIELPAVRESRIRGAELGQASTEYTLAETRLAVRGAVKQAFYTVFRRRSEVDLARENLKLVEDLLRRVRIQVEVGEAARLELTRAEAEVTSAQSLARSAQLRLVNAFSMLRAVVAAPLGAEPELIGTLDPPATLPPIEEARKSIYARHPALAQTQAEIQRAEARLRNEQAQRKPQPTVRGEFENQPDLRFFRLGISIPLPVWNRREGPIGEASAAIVRAKAFDEFRRLEIAAALERAYGQYELAGQLVARYEQGALREAEAALRAAEAAYRFGERGIIEVLDAQRVLRSVRLDYLNAQYDRQSALIDLEQLQVPGVEKKP